MSAEITPKLDLSKYVDTSLMGERPHVRGRRLPVTYIASARETQQLSIAELAEEYTLSESEVLAALLYYAENKDMLDVQDAAEQHLFDTMPQRNET